MSGPALRGTISVEHGGLTPGAGGGAWGSVAVVGQAGATADRRVVAPSGGRGRGGVGGSGHDSVLFSVEDDV